VKAVTWQQSTSSGAAQAGMTPALQHEEGLKRFKNHHSTMHLKQ